MDVQWIFNTIFSMYSLNKRKTLRSLILIHSAKFAQSAYFYFVQKNKVLKCVYNIFTHFYTLK